MILKLFEIDSKSVIMAVEKFRKMILVTEIKVDFIALYLGRREEW